MLQVDEGVASGAGLGLAMRLFDLDGFEILYEEKLQTKVPPVDRHLHRRYHRYSASYDQCSMPASVLREWPLSSKSSDCASAIPHG